MNAKESNANILQDLERYFRDPGFDRNTVLDLGKRKMSWRDTGFHRYSRSRIPQNLDAGCCIRKETLFGTQTTEVRDHAGLSCKKKRECGIRTPFQTLIFLHVSSNDNIFLLLLLHSDELASEALYASWKPFMDTNETSNMKLVIQQSTPDAKSSTATLG